MIYDCLSKDKIFICPKLVKIIERTKKKSENKLKHSYSAQHEI